RTSYSRLKDHPKMPEEPYFLTLVELLAAFKGFLASSLAGFTLFVFDAAFVGTAAFAGADAFAGAAAFTGAAALTCAEALTGAGALTAFGAFPSFTGTAAFEGFLTFRSTATSLTSSSGSSTILAGTTGSFSAFRGSGEGILARSSTQLPRS